MSLSAQDIVRLYYHAQDGSLTPVEQQEWETFLAGHPEQAVHFSQLEQTALLGQAFKERAFIQEQQRSEDLLSVILGRLPFAPNRTVPAVHRIHFLRRGWFRYAAAILFIIGLGSVFYLWNMKNENALISVTKPVPHEKNDALPGSDKAILTLEDGQQIQLDSTANAMLAYRGISNNNALIAYSGKGQENVLNTLSTPKGGQYKLRLPDGSMVWLNAASSITYPTTFAGADRAVSVTGEAYFEVAKNKEKPFIVTTSNDRIEVLGTSFNVKAYPDEKVGKISLLEGAVKVNDKTIRPGQAYQNGQIIATNMQQDIAWKNGQFDFNHVRLEEAMRQLERWYDIRVEYPHQIPDVEFIGEMDRTMSLNKVLKILKAVKIKFELNDRVLTVTQ